MKSKLLKATVLFGSVFALAACGNQADDKEATSTSSAQSEVSSSVASESKAETSSKTDADTQASAEELKDGTYELETPMSDNGWKTAIKMVVKDGKIDSVDYEGYDKDGHKKSEDEEYQTKMKDKSGTSSNEAIKQLVDQLLEKQVPEKVDTVSGASHTSEAFKGQMRQLIEAAKKGDTTKIMTKEED
ncbi:MAG: FMN-binding protein [Aerococcus sp.]|nr:FMN-binding protein [Aerococcus sp.]